MTLHWPIVLFLISLLVPWIITIGPIRMSVYRFVLIAMLVPCLVMWIGGKAGRIRVSDITVILFCIWCFIAMTQVHGLGYSVQPAGMVFIETVGAYMLARCGIRNADDFKAMIRILFLIVVSLLPFAIFEAATGRNILLETFGSVYPVFADSYLDPRWGLRRVQSVFQHPILFGVFCASSITFTHIVLGEGQSVFRRWLQTGAVTFAAMLSLSAGPMTAVAGQGMLLGWNWLMRGYEARWRVLWGFALLAYVPLELFSNRSVPVIFISYFAFDEQSARVRVDIWEHGMASVFKHPLFGVGFNEWERAPWMSKSIDMFWIIDAIRHGAPAGILMVLTFFSLYFAVVRKQGLDARVTLYRTTYLIAMTGFFLVGWTVYFWNATYVAFLFLIGSGAWILDAEPVDAASPKRGSTPTPRRQPADGDGQKIRPLPNPRRG